MTRKTMFSLEGKITIVTGGARGIGKIVAKQMAMMGSDIAIVDILRNEGLETACEIEKNYGVKSMAYTCDVTDPNQTNKTVNEIANDFGGIDVLFNNAGIVLHKAALEVTPEEWTKIFDVNTHGVFYMARSFAKKLIELERGGSIINNASMSATVVNFPQEQASYNSSKAAVIQMTKSLAVEWHKYGIRVNSISPGYIFTDLTAHVKPEWLDKWAELTPIKRFGKCEELAGAVIYFASDCSSFTSGSNLIIDGLYSAV